MEFFQQNVRHLQTYFHCIISRKGLRHFIDVLNALQYISRNRSKVVANGIILFVFLVLTDTRISNFFYITLFFIILFYNHFFITLFLYGIFYNGLFYKDFFTQHFFILAFYNGLFYNLTPNTCGPLPNPIGINKQPSLTSP